MKLSIRFFKPHYICFLLLCSSVQLAYAQGPNRGVTDTLSVREDWFLLDPDTDDVEGMGVDRAYNELLHDSPSHPVIVAVIDSGVDIDHEDLKKAIWTNEDEVPDNGIDDDHNGYVDDVHGWNFIGGKTGNVDFDTNELSREYVRLKNLFETGGKDSLRAANRDDYEYYRSIKKRFENRVEDNMKKLEHYSSIYERTLYVIDSLKSMIGTDTLSEKQVAAFQVATPLARSMKAYILYLFNEVLFLGSTLKDFMDELRQIVKHTQDALKYTYNESFDPRPIVGDRYDKPYEKRYGNNDIKGSDASHGTHVAGIIAANRNNDIGIRGIADNVRIMPIRAVPSGGDERDKDIANAIIYAVDNGARIINMSFGKSLSPFKKAVDKAVRYAEKKGVLMVHAAGNSGKNIDLTQNFPSRYYAQRGGECHLWLEVGASSWKADSHLVADFSNYGQKMVDVFAPGVYVKSTLPDNDYGVQQGTSMACPMVTASAALLISYFPQLSASQVKDIIVRSARRYEKVLVTKPGSENSEQVEFTALSRTGGTVNLYQAVKAAQKRLH